MAVSLGRQLLRKQWQKYLVRGGGSQNELKGGEWTFFWTTRSRLFSLCERFAALFAASEIGHGIGLRSSGEANVSTLEASVLGLLALVLSFTFAMALTRFEERRDGVLIEANAIGTASLRAGLLPAPHGVESVKLFRDYVQVRLDLAKRVPTPPLDRIEISGGALAGGQSGYGLPHKARSCAHALRKPRCRGPSPMRR